MSFDARGGDNVALCFSEMAGLEGGGQVGIQGPPQPLCLPSPPPPDRAKACVIQGKPREKEGITVASSQYSCSKRTLWK